jgi:hypothetical protein
MEQFFKDFQKYSTEASYNTFWFWGIIILTIVGIWLLTTVGLKIFRKREKLKTVFFVHKAWIISSLIAATVIISFICYHWTQNGFSVARNDYRLVLLIALAISMLIPIISLLGLRTYYRQENIKEITGQPKTKLQIDKVIPRIKRAYTHIKWFFLIPLLGFLFLLFYLYKGTNLISLVYDNSISMIGNNAIDALSETFSSLEDNNEIILTTFNGLSEGKNNMNEIMTVKQSSNLRSGNVILYNNPKNAMNGLSAQLSEESPNSPIAESIWKMWLVVNETKANQTYKNKLLIVITDGDDPICSTLTSGNFFFDDTKFAEYFAPQDVFVIDYSEGHEMQFCDNNYFRQRFENAGCRIYDAENSKESYLNALDEALQSFKNNWNLIFWTIFIFSFFTIIALLIPPKKII